MPHQLKFETDVRNMNDLTYTYLDNKQPKLNFITQLMTLFVTKCDNINKYKTK